MTCATTMTVSEAARLLGVSRATAYKAARDGELPTIRLRGRVLVLREPLHRMLGTNAAHTQEPGQ